MVQSNCRDRTVFCQKKNRQDACSTIDSLSPCGRGIGRGDNKNDFTLSWPLPSRERKEK